MPFALSFGVYGSNNFFIVLLDITISDVLIWLGVGWCGREWCLYPVWNNVGIDLKSRTDRNYHIFLLKWASSFQNYPMTRLLSARASQSRPLTTTTASTTKPTSPISTISSRALSGKTDLWRISCSSTHRISQLQGHQDLQQCCTALEPHLLLVLHHSRPNRTLRKPQSLHREKMGQCPELPYLILCTGRC